MRTRGKQGWRLAAGSCAVAMALAGCGGADDETAAEPPPPAAETEDPGTTPGDEDADADDDPAEPAPTSDGDARTPVVELVDAGDEPHEPLRYAFSEGTAVSGSLSMTFQHTSLALDGEPAPPMPAVPMEVELTAEVGDIGEDVAEVWFTFGEARVGDVDLPADERSELEAALSVLEGVTGSYLSDDRGQVSAGDLDLGSVPGFEQLGDQLTSLAVPLPEEPVGPGAVWTVTQTTDIGGIGIDQVTEVRLVARDGDVVTLELAIEGSSPPGPLELDAVPGVVVDLVRSVTSGTGAVVSDLGSPFPTRAEATAVADQELHFEEAGQQHVLEQSMRFETVFESG